MSGKKVEAASHIELPVCQLGGQARPLLPPVPGPLLVIGKFIKPRCNEFAALLRPVAAPGCAALPCTPWPSVLIIPTISSLIHTLW